MCGAQDGKKDTSWNGESRWGTHQDPGWWTHRQAVGKSLGGSWSRKRKLGREAAMYAPGLFRYLPPPPQDDTETGIQPPS